MANLFVVLAVVVAGLAAVYLVLRSRIDRSVARLDPAAEIRDELASVMVEMNRTTDRNVALLEDRIAQLTQLLADADRKILLLRREGEKHEASRRVYSHLARPAAARGVERAAADGAASPTEGSAPPPPPARPAPEPSLEARVLMLEREGLAPAAIANRVGSTVGEVELIISLARRRH